MKLFVSNLSDRQTACDLYFTFAVLTVSSHIHNYLYCCYFSLAFRPLNVLSISICQCLAPSPATSGQDTIT